MAGRGLNVSALIVKEMAWMLKMELCVRLVEAEGLSKISQASMQHIEYVLEHTLHCT